MFWLRYFLILFIFLREVWGCISTEQRGGAALECWCHHLSTQNNLWGFFGGLQGGSYPALWMELDWAAPCLADSWYFLWLPSFHRHFSLNLPFRSHFMAIFVLRKNASLSEGVDWTEMLDVCRPCSSSTLALRSVRWPAHISGAVTHRADLALQGFYWELQSWAARQAEQAALRHCHCLWHLWYPADQCVCDKMVQTVHETRSFSVIRRNSPAWNWAPAFVLNLPV